MVHIRMDEAELFVAQSIGLASLVLAGVALVLIECWGIKKILHLMKGQAYGRSDNR